MKNSPLPYIPKCIIIDPNPISQQILSNIIAQIQGIKLIGIGFGIYDAFPAIKKISPFDLLVLGVSCHEPGAFEIAIKLRSYVKFIVFCSEDTRCALDVFRAGGDQFIVMPASAVEFCAKVARLLNKDLKAYRKEIIWVKQDNILKIPILSSAK